MYRVDDRKPHFRPNDPAVYGMICPHCQKRYGNKQEYIILVRCDQCPSFKDSMLYYRINQNIKKRRSRAKKWAASVEN